MTQEILPPEPDPERNPLSQTDLPPELEFTPVPRRTKRWNGITATKQRQFIVNLAATGAVKMAAASIATSPSAMYQLRRAEGAESFAAAWDRAVEMGARRVLDTLMEHAIHGTPETLLQDGRILLERRKYNTRAMQWIVQQRFPEEYGGSLNVSGIPGSATPHSIRKLKEEWRAEWAGELRASDEDLEAELLKRLKALGKRLIYSQAFRHVGHPEHMAAYDLLHGPQDWEDIARVKARREADPMAEAPPEEQEQVRRMLGGDSSTDS